MLAAAAAKKFLWASIALFFLANTSLAVFAAQPQEPISPNESSSKSVPTQSTDSGKQNSPKQDPGQELQQALNSAGNDRAALVRNLEAFLKKYPEAPQRVQIYRALVEASIQLRDTARAADYAERIVALSPDDMSITLLVIQLLERNGDEAATRRAVNYATRILEYVNRSSPSEKSVRISQEQWEQDKKRDQSSVLQMRGRLHEKLKEIPAAQKDFEESDRILPSAAAEEELGEIAELHKDLNLSISQYAHAFALAENATGAANRREIRKKLGNVWRLQHGSDEGLGDYLLKAFDDTAQGSSQKTAAAKSKKNADGRDPFDFTLRKAPEGSPFPLASVKGKVLVVNFWATWCGPCHALAPLFERVSTQFQANDKVLFLSANCDEDETLVGPYLAEEKPQTTVVFADGLDRLFGVTAFPTVVVIDTSGKVAYRAEGFDYSGFEAALNAAIHRALSTETAQQ